MTHQIMLHLPAAVVASEELYLAVRAGFIAQGTSLSAWCKVNGLNRQTAEKALKGERHSRRSHELLSKVLEASFPADRGQ